MNLLLDRPPTKIEVGGLFYEIDADFRTGIAFELLMLDKEFTETEKAKGDGTIFPADTRR